MTLGCRRLGPVLAGVAWLATAGCTLRTDPGDELRVYYTPMDRDVPGEVDWPERPNVFGGISVLVRGAMVSPCGSVVSRAARSGQVVTVQIVSTDDSRGCPASRFLQPFEAEVTGLRPGQYEVRLRITSVKAVAPTLVTISAP